MNEYQITAIKEILKQYEQFGCVYLLPRQQEALRAIVETSSPTPVGLGGEKEKTLHTDDDEASELYEVGIVETFTGGITLNVYFDGGLVETSIHYQVEKEFGLYYVEWDYEPEHSIRLKLPEQHWSVVEEKIDDELTSWLGL